MERCPICGARWRDQTSCRRCGAEFNQVLQAQERAQKLTRLAIQRLDQGDSEGSARLAQRAVFTHSTPLTRILPDFFLAAGIVPPQPELLPEPAENQTAVGGQSPEKPTVQDVLPANIEKNPPNIPMQNWMEFPTPPPTFADNPDTGKQEKEEEEEEEEVKEEVKEEEVKEEEVKEEEEEVKEEVKEIKEVKEVEEDKEKEKEKREKKKKKKKGKKRWEKDAGKKGKKRREKDAKKTEKK